MADQPPSQTAPADAEMLAALSRLARKGAYAEPVDGSAGAYAVYSPRNAFGRPIATLSAAVVAQGLRLNWVELDQRPGCYRLAAAGGKALRRARCGVSAVRSESAKAPRRRADPGALARAVHETPLAWLSRRKDAQGQPMISATQRAAGERLSADFWHAQMTPRVTANWSGVAASRSERRAAPGVGIELSDRVVAARERVNRVLSALGPEMAGILLDVCCHEIGLEAAEQARGWPRRAAKVVLDMALTGLARHYGMIAAGPASQGLRHWGGEDYRPTLDAWQSQAG